MKTTERKPKYAMRKLTVGLVSCMLGFALIATPSHSLAAGGDGEEVATEVEEELKDAPTELENDEPVDNNDGLELDKSEEKEIERVAEPQADEEQYMFDIRWENKQLKEGQYANYDPKLKDTNIDAQFCLEIEGTYVDENGNKITETVYSNWVNKKLKVGETSTIDIRELKYRDGIDIEKYESIGYKSLIWPVNPYTGNYRWNLTDGSYDDNNENPNRYFTEINQSMSTRVEYEQEDESIILDEDQNNINLKYNIKKKDSDELFKNRKRGNVVVTEEEKFTTEERNEWDKWLSTKRPEADDDSMNMAIRSAYLESFNRYVNRKDREFELVVDFKGKDDKDTQRLKKYYTLNITGDDLNGWTVTLGSNLKDKIESSDEYIYYTTEYVEDETLDEGVRVLVKDGENGIIRETIRTIYLPGEDGKEEIIDKKVSSKKIKDMIGRIIRIGTKKKTPDTPDKPDPENPDKPTPDTPDKPNPENPDKPIPDTPDKPEITDNQGDLTQEERDELEKLIKDLIDEMNKEEETPDTKPEDTKKPTENEEVKPSENEEETKKPEKEDKKEEDKKKPGKKNTAAPAKAKKADQKSSKDASPKTGVTGSASILALLGSSLLASLGLRKKND